MNFKQLHSNLVDEAKKQYPDSEFIQAMDSNYSINHLCVSEVFTLLSEMENSTDMCFKWNQDINDILTSKVIENLKNDFQFYLKSVQHMEV